MGTKALQPAAKDLYDEDFAVWTEQTASLLRAGRFDQIDVEHLAEEVEDMGKSQRHEVQSRLTVLIIHLLKWKFQPEQRFRSWNTTIATQRVELDRCFEHSPSLRRHVSESVARVYSDSVHLAAIETGLPQSAFPPDCPFSVEQILDRSFLPQ